MCLLGTLRKYVNQRKETWNHGNRNLTKGRQLSISFREKPINIGAAGAG